MFEVETLSARISTLRTPFSAGPTVTRNDQGRAPSSPKLNATPPPSGRRRLRLIFSKFHLLPRCWSSTTRLPFFRSQRPGTRALLAQAECHAAAERPAQAEADILKIPFVAALLVIDHQTAVLQIATTRDARPPRPS